MNYYEHHLGDYVRDAGHLSMLEDGAYRRLIDAYYIREAALPAGLEDVCRLIRARKKAEREAVAHVLREFFRLSEDGWHHSRCDREIARYVEKREKAKANANARWSPAMRSHCEGNAHQTPIPNPQTPESLRGREESGKEKKLFSDEREKEGARLGPDWTPDEAGLGFALSLGFTREEAQFEAAKFRDYWLGRAGREGLKRDWDATWRNWARNAGERRAASGLRALPPGAAAEKPSPVFLVTRGEPEHAAWLAHYVRIGRHRDPRASFLDRLSVPQRWPPEDAAETAEAAFHDEQDLHRPAGEQGA